MKRNAFWAVLVAILSAGCYDDDTPLSPDLAVLGSSGIAKVTSSSDNGPGSLRAALEAANLDPSISTIAVDGYVGVISLATPLVFGGSQELLIAGRGVTLDGSGLVAGESAILADGGGNLTIRALAVENAPGPGIVVDVPDDATGTVLITLADVRATNNGSHGVLINDQTEFFNDPASVSEAGSPAGLLVTVTGSHFEKNGLTDLDQDGLRINEGGEGNLVANIDHTTVRGNGGDGIELDERAAGDAIFSVTHAQLDANGSFSSADFDDGIDVDESGDGDINGRFRHVIASNNFEQGIDINENGAGNIRTILDHVSAFGNAEEGIEYEEDDDVPGGGDIIADLSDVTSTGNGSGGGDAGLKLREKGIGNLSVTMRNVEASQNLFGGMQLREDSDGDLFAVGLSVTADANAEDGIDFDENGNGNLNARLQGVTNASNNGEAGIDAEQQSAGTGQLQYRVLNATGNVDGPIDGDAGVVVTQVP